MDTLLYKLEDLKIQKTIRKAVWIIQLLPENNMEKPMMAPIEAITTESTPETPETLETEATPQGYKMVDVILQANYNFKNLLEATPFWIKVLYFQDGWELIEGFLIKDKTLYILLHDNWRIYLIDEIHSRLPTTHPDCDKTKKLLQA